MRGSGHHNLVREEGWSPNQQQRASRRKTPQLTHSRNKLLVYSSSTDFCPFSSPFMWSSRLPPPPLLLLLLLPASSSPPPHVLHSKTQSHCTPVLILPTVSNPTKTLHPKSHPPNSSSNNSAKHLCLSHTISRNFGTKLTKLTPASFLPSLQPNANKPQRGKEEEASQSASNRPLASSSSSLCPDPENATKRSKAHRRQPQTKRSFLRRRRRRRRPSSQSEREERGLTESERQKTEARRERETCQGLFH